MWPKCFHIVVVGHVVPEERLYEHGRDKSTRLMLHLLSANSRGGLTVCDCWNKTMLELNKLCNHTSHLPSSFRANVNHFYLFPFMWKSSVCCTFLLHSIWSSFSVKAATTWNTLPDNRKASVLSEALKSKWKICWKLFSTLWPLTLHFTVVFVCVWCNCSLFFFFNHLSCLSSLLNKTTFNGYF